MTCAQVRAMFSDYLNSELNASDRRDVSAHLDACRSCALDLQQVHETVYWMRSMERVAPPADLVKRVRAAVAKSGPTTRRGEGDQALRMHEMLEARRARKRPATVWWWRSAGALAIAAVAVFAFVGPRRQHSGDGEQKRGLVATSTQAGNDEADTVVASSTQPAMAPESSSGYEGGEGEGNGSFMDSPSPETTNDDASNARREELTDLLSGAAEAPPLMVAMAPEPEVTPEPETTLSITSADASNRGETDRDASAAPSSEPPVATTVARRGATDIRAPRTVPTQAAPALTRPASVAPMTAAAVEGELPAPASPTDSSPRDERGAALSVHHAERLPAAAARGGQGPARPQDGAGAALDKTVRAKDAGGGGVALGGGAEHLARPSSPSALKRETPVAAPRPSAPSPTAAASVPPPSASAAPVRQPAKSTPAPAEKPDAAPAKVEMRLDLAMTAQVDKQLTGYVRLVTTRPVSQVRVSIRTRGRVTVANSTGPSSALGAEIYRGPVSPEQVVRVPVALTPRSAGSQQVSVAVVDASGRKLGELRRSLVVKPKPAVIVAAAPPAHEKGEAPGKGDKARAAKPTGTADKTKRSAASGAKGQDRRPRFQILTPGPVTVTRSFFNADVRDVIEYVARRWNKKVFIKGAVGGRITIRFSRETPEKALRRLCQMQGYKLDVNDFQVTIINELK